MKSIDLIRKHFKESGELSVKELVDRTGLSKQIIHIGLIRLLDEGVVEKLGKAPKTIYRISKKDVLQSSEKGNFTDSDIKFLDENIMVVSESGDLLLGSEAFNTWWSQRKLPVDKTFSEFVKTKRKYEKYYDSSGIINGLEKLNSTKGYEKIWLDQLFYLDFYAIERFGKTKLGSLLHYAKQGQNKYLMRLMMSEIKGRILSFLETVKADAICYVPPTIRRELQLMKFIENDLSAPFPVIDIKKISGIIPVPQKSLSKLEERIKNAENTFAITEKRKFNHIVLLDDAVGSGSTLNQIAGKIKNKEIASKVTGLAIVGSFKGFDVITDV